jgi:hypothetical protein
MRGAGIYRAGQLTHRGNTLSTILRKAVSPQPLHAAIAMAATKQDECIILSKHFLSLLVYHNSAPFLVPNRPVRLY